MECAVETIERRVVVAVVFVVLYITKMYFDSCAGGARTFLASGSCLNLYYVQIFNKFICQHNIIC